MHLLEVHFRATVESCGHSGGGKRYAPSRYITEPQLIELAGIPAGGGALFFVSSRKSPSTRASLSWLVAKTNRTVLRDGAVEPLDVSLDPLAARRKLPLSVHAEVWSSTWAWYRGSFEESFAWGRRRKEEAGKQQTEESMNVLQGMVKDAREATHNTPEVQV